MKKISFLILLNFSFSFLHGQHVKIEGFIKQSAIEQRYASIAVNDTLNKIKNLTKKDFKKISKITNDSTLVTFTNDKKGYFSISAKPTDTLFFQFGRLYYPEKHLVSDLMKYDTIIIDPIRRPCLSENECNQKVPSKTYIFIGKKIEVLPVDTSEYCNNLLDSKSRAIYKIEKEFSEHHSNSIITFTAYDHNSSYDGIFNNYDHVLINVGDYCGELLYLKYQFFPVYKTKNGRWASPVQYKFESLYDFKELQPAAIEFDHSVSFDISPSLSPEQIEHKFSKKYYKIKNSKAYPIMGRYAEDLVKLIK
ncbi:hypothetical protein [Chryseobacterium sp. JUb7]|uniref:hypothetical protein n=1 Tax=Chryseobacterium sp. JUb7 TaxID=2940599 RepID=UPI00216A3164|nr:hypothetical protein [Chryseobacterium sp. JUb7]MCS3529157.1 hypothetical protein [Chryseobacterium sp. JUb7]